MLGTNLPAPQTLTPKALTCLASTVKPPQGILRKLISCIASLSIVAGGMPLSLAQAQVVADPNAGAGQRPGVTHPQNTHNVPVVNIAGPNGAGVSHNYYGQFNVDQQGLILNNSPYNTPTYLGGWVQGNPNMGGGPARIILNEVNGGQPSHIQGYVEVAGMRAEVIIANPAGIAVNGGGFINASGVTLTTGIPIFNTYGNLESFRVGRLNPGLITIGEGGLDTSGADYTRIIGRSVQVNAGIWAQDLTITAGTGTIAPNGNPIQLTTEDPSAQPNDQPTYAIDVAQLGGMYAGKIHLIGTQNGVGVRNAGEIGTSAGDVIVTANGHITNTGTISSYSNLQLTSEHAGITNNGTLYGQGGVYLQSQEQQLTNNGTIAAAYGIHITAQNIHNQAQGTIVAGLKGNGQFANQGTLTANASQGIINSGTLNAAGGVNLTAPTLHNQEGGVIASGLQNHNGQNAQNAQNTQPGALHINAVQSITNEGTLNAGGQNAISKIHTANLTNTGTIYAVSHLLIENANIAGSTLTNSGTLAAGGNMNLAAQTITNTTDSLIAAGFKTDGTFASPGNLNIKGTTVTNAGQMLAGQLLQIQGQQLINREGTIHAEKTLTLLVQTLNNQQGLISAGEHLQIGGNPNTGNNTATNHIDNTSGTLISGGSSTIRANNLQNAEGQILAEDNLELHIGQAYTHGAGAQLVSNGNLKLTVDGLLTNAGTIFASKHLQLMASNLDNQASGDINAGTNDITVTGQITNRGLIDGGLTYLSANAINNIGTGRIYGSHIAIKANSLTNQGETLAAKKTTATIAARERLDIGVKNLYNKDGSLIFSSKDLIIGGDLDADHLAQGSATLVQNEGSTIEALGHVFINAANINNTNAHFEYEEIATTPVAKYSIIANGKEYFPEDILIYNTVWGNEMPAPTTLEDFVAFMNLGADKVMLVFPDGSSTVIFVVYAYEETHYTPETTASSPGQILSGGNMILTGDVTNDKSRILAGETLQITGRVETIDAEADQYQVRQGLMIMSTLSGGDRKWNYQQALPHKTDPEKSTTITLVAATPEQHTNVPGTGTTPPDQGTGIHVDAPNGGTGIQIGRPNIQLPNNSLYLIHAGAGKNYLIETDPRFTSYGDWASSELMLLGLGLDPATMLKRMGDGYYEQQLIREQIGRLTGFRFLAGYNSDDEQYKALMNAGIEYAQEIGLTVGIALTPEQMQMLTSDIVWLVNADVTLPDGTIETVLVPQVYARSGTNMITPDGALMSANNVVIGAPNTGTDTAANRATGTSVQTNTQKPTVINNATIAAREGLFIDSAYLQNAGGQLHGTNVVLQSQTDIDNVGGVISADTSLIMLAERDINITSQTNQLKGTYTSGTELGNIGMVYVSGNTADANTAPDPDQTTGMHIQAGRDINLTSAYIVNDYKPELIEPSNNGNHNANNNVAQTKDVPKTAASVGAGNADGKSGPQADTKVDAKADTKADTKAPPRYTGDTTLVAGRNLNIDTVETSFNMAVIFDPKNWMISDSTQEVGAELYTQGHINLLAGGDLNIKGATLDSSQGNLTLAAQNINITAANSTTNYAQSAYKKSGSGLSKSSTHRMNLGNNNTLTSSNLGAQQIHIQATNDVNVTASNIIATGAVNLIADQGNININHGEERSTTLDYEKNKQSGLLKGGGFCITIGKSKDTRTAITNTTTALSSTIGSMGGDVNLIAQKGSYNQTGSDVLSLQGDINVIAQDINITEARETYSRFERQEHKQTGLSIGITSPLMSAAQTIQHMNESSKKTDNGRMKALAAGAAGLHIYNNLGGGEGEQGILNALSKDGLKNPIKTGGLGISASLGSSKSESMSLQNSNTAKGSSLAAGGSVNLIATGDGNPSTPNQPNTSGNIFIQGSQVHAGKDIALIAQNQIDIRAAVNDSTEISTSKSSSSSVGATLSSAGWGLNAGMSKTKGQGFAVDKEWTASKVNAGGNLLIQSGGNTNIIGSQVGGYRVQADIGGDLNIESLQNTSIGHSSQKSSSLSLNVSLDAAMSLGSMGGSVGKSKATANGIHMSVGDYAGIMAGDGGFQINVKGNTDLKGAIIASTQGAVDNNKNEFTTGTLTINHIGNVDMYESKGSSMGASANWGQDESGNFTNMPSFGAPTALKGKDSGSDFSFTLSGISGGKLTITDSDKQQQLTGLNAEQMIESINTSVHTGQSANGLNKNWNTQQLVDEMQANMDIAEAFNREAGQFVATKAKDEEAAREKAKEDIENTTDPQERERLQAIIDAKPIWGMGGSGRLIITALTSSIGGNVAGSGSELLQGMAVNVIQGLGAQQIKKLVDDHLAGDDTARAALHAILACGGAAAQSADCGSAALGAGAGTIIHSLMGNKIKDPITGEMRELTAKEKEERMNLVGTIVGGITYAAGGDASIAAIAAKIEAENNQFMIVPGYNNEHGTEYYFSIRENLLECSKNNSCNYDELVTKYQEQENFYLELIAAACEDPLSLACSTRINNLNRVTTDLLVSSQFNFDPDAKKYAELIIAKNQTLVNMYYQESSGKAVNIAERYASGDIDALQGLAEMSYIGAGEYLDRFNLAGSAFAALNSDEQHAVEGMLLVLASKKLGGKKPPTVTAKPNTGKPPSTTAGTPNAAINPATGTPVTEHKIVPSGKAPHTSTPNSIYEVSRADGSKSITYYDAKGRTFSREDYGQIKPHGQMGLGSDGKVVPHEHKITYNADGYVNGKYYRQLDATGKPIGDWINDKR